MAVSEEYRDYVLEQFSFVLPVTWRKMFGGVGVWSGERFFALIADDVLYFKVDESNLRDYESRGMQRFEHMRYYAVPEDVLDDPGDLREWALKAITVEGRKRAK